MGLIGMVGLLTGERACQFLFGQSLRAFFF